MLWASWCKNGLENLKRGNHSEDRSGARMREEAERVGFVQLENRLRGNLIAVCNIHNNFRDGRLFLERGRE